MNYQHMSNQISNLDYLGLVNMLINPISPDVRAIVLARLVEMNNQLLMGMRSGMMNIKQNPQTNQWEQQLNETDLNEIIDDLNSDRDTLDKKLGQDKESPK